VGFYIDAPEITPHIPAAGTRRFDGSGARVALIFGADELAQGQVAVKPLRADEGGSAPAQTLQPLSGVAHWGPGLRAA